MRIFNFAVVFFLLSAMLGCHRAPPPAGDETQVSGNSVTLDQKAAAGIVTVRATQAAAASLELPGRLVWNEDATVRIFSPFAGRVAKILVRQGDRVSAGQTLALLSSPDYGSAQADYQKAVASLELARKARDRARDLLQHGVVAGKDAEQADSDYANAEAEAQRAQARLKLFGNTGDHGARGDPSGSLLVDQMFPLKSAISGVVVDKAINPGQEIFPDQPGTPPFVVTDPSKLWVELSAHESDLAALKLGQNFELTSGEYPDQKFPGTLTQIADFVDPATRAIRVRGEVANLDRRLKAEMYVSAQLELPSAPAAAVPSAAVFLIGSQQYLFVSKSSGQFERRAVRTGPESRGLIEIVDGVEPGEAVVSDGALYLQQQLASAGGMP